MFKFRLPKETEAAAWKTLHEKPPPATQRYITYVLVRVPAAMPLFAVQAKLKATLSWETEQAREALNGRGANARKRVYLAARGPPSSSQIDLDGTIANIREEIVFDNVKPASTTATKEHLFQRMDEERAAYHGRRCMG